MSCRHVGVRAVVCTGLTSVAEVSDNDNTYFMSWYKLPSEGNPSDEVADVARGLTTKYVVISLILSLLACAETAICSVSVRVLYAKTKASVCGTMFDLT